MPQAKAKAEVRSRFSQQLESLVRSSRQIAAGLKNEDRRHNYLPDPNGWDGNLSDLAGIAKAFDRSENTEDVLAAISDATDPGVVGDLIASSWQGDYLATQERAFRSRHTSSVRRRLQAAARRQGHGDDRGLFKRGVLGEVENILKQSKDT